MNSVNIKRALLLKIPTKVCILMEIQNGDVIAANLKRANNKQNHWVNKIWNNKKKTKNHSVRIHC